MRWGDCLGLFRQARVMTRVLREEGVGESPRRSRKRESEEEIGQRRQKSEGCSHKLRNGGCLQKQEKSGNGFSPRASRRHAAVPTS